MRPRQHRLGMLAALLVVAACENGNIGRPPPLDELFFPSGILLDPRPATLSDGTVAPPRYLFVVNSNNDLHSNAGTLTAIDLDAFFAKWSLTDEHGPTYVVDPYCSDERCVHDVGSSVSRERPCRRLALLPQVVECDERPFIERDDTVRTGDFATILASSCNDADLGADGSCDRYRLWLPVRGDPSLTYIDLHGAPGEAPGFECGQADDKDERCDKAHRLTHMLNDTSLVDMDREPFNLLVSPSEPFVYVSHADGSSLSLIDRRHPSQCCVASSEATCNVAAILQCVCEDHGHPECCPDASATSDAERDPAWTATCADVAARRCGVCEPAMIDQAVAFPSLGGLSGGLGLAERPCVGGEDAPSITIDCSRPLVYAAFRYSRLLVSFTVQGVTPADLEQDQYEQKCAGPGEIDQAQTIVCDPRVRSQRQVFPGGLDPGPSSFTPVLGDIAFSDDTGDQLLVVQTNPGALLLLDTSVGPDGEVVDNPSRPPLEICDQPTRMKLYEEAGQRFALISCYNAAQIFVVDLDAFRVVQTIVTGTGPFELEVDVARRLLYLSNNLERSISVIDLARDRPTRFNEIARIGLQEPFSR